jgi:sirohydrochlorin cobaltochelatase
MRPAIVLAMHGSPPRDFPHHETAELFGLHARLHQTRGPERDELARRHDELEARMRTWPRSADNDAFWAASHELADHLRHRTGMPVAVGFNEFCAPTIEEALGQLVEGGADRVVVMTPMMTRGGEHSEVDIPLAVDRAREAHPGVEILYAWPFEPADVAAFLESHMRAFL